MGFTINYRSTRPIPPAQADAIGRDVAELSQVRTWLSCEPVHFYPGEADGHMAGASKPNFLPDPGDADAAAREGLPDGTPRDLLDVLCQLSRDHRVDWEVGHEYSGGPLGFVRGGVADREVVTMIEAFPTLDDLRRESGLDEDD